ncbi:MAG: hypothetical protein CVV50_04175 [Spirochaetae bacterium HGW-Spirochaetae-6]|nr:MAG: hypothetical protein CVV50_04175 [Spirochaetae bacterium HGW-Spirochaetae-6]
MENTIFLEALKLIQQFVRKPWGHFTEMEVEALQNSYQTFFKIFQNPLLARESMDFFEKNMELFDLALGNFRKQYSALGQAYQENLKRLTDFISDLQHLGQNYRK